MRNVDVDPGTGVAGANRLEAATSVPEPPWLHNPFRYLDNAPEVIRLAAMVDIR
jgi:hypothetical protein